MLYKKDTPRLTLQIINEDTEEVIATVYNRNWLNIGEFLTDHYISEIMKQKNTQPKKIMVLVTAEYKKQKDG